jgi:nucleoside-diphosphate kinase
MKTLYDILEVMDKLEFVIIKPEFLRYQQEIEDILLSNGFSINKKLKKTLSLDEAMNLYKMHENEDFYEDLCKYMSSGDSVGYILNNRKNKDLSKLKDQIREKYGRSDMKNVMHSSDSQENVTRESKIYFSTNLQESILDDEEEIISKNTKISNDFFNSFVVRVLQDLGNGGDENVIYKRLNNGELDDFLRDFLSVDIDKIRERVRWRVRLFDNSDFDCKTPTFEIKLDYYGNYIVKIAYSPLAYMHNALLIYVPRMDLRTSLNRFPRHFINTLDCTNYIQNYKDIKKKFKKEGFIEKTKSKEFVIYTKTMLF